MYIVRGMLTFLFSKLSLLKYDENGQLDQGSIIPIIDGGTEGSNIFTLLQALLMHVHKQF